MALDSSTNPQNDDLPAELPPVEPPSAAFIVQLFVVPGVIVLGIVILWWGINRLAQPDQDWRSLVADLQSPHEHLRWQGAFGLAQLLQADASGAFQKGKAGGAFQKGKQEGAGGAVGEPRLVENRAVAKELTDLLEAEFKRGSTKDDDLQRESFLTATLGLFEIPDAVLPTLRLALRPEHDADVRKNALRSIAMIAGREAEKGHPLDDEALVADVLAISEEEEPLMRQMAAFNLGILGGDAARTRLEVLLADGDADTRTNAAIGLARRGSTAGLPVLQQIFKAAQAGVGPVTKDGLVPKSDEEYQLFLTLKNALAAIEKLIPVLSAEEKLELAGLLKPIAAGFREPRLRVDAEHVVLALE